MDPTPGSRSNDHDGGFDDHHCGFDDHHCGLGDHNFKTLNMNHELHPHLKIQISLFQQLKLKIPISPGSPRDLQKKRHCLPHRFNLTMSYNLSMFLGLCTTRKDITSFLTNLFQYSRRGSNWRRPNWQNVVPRMV